MTLDDLRIASPCSADWDAMPGDARVRTCSDCNKRVYNLAAMTRAEAEALIASRERPCVRLYRRRDGRVVTADCAPPLRKLTRRVVAGAFAALAGGCLETSDEVVDDPAPDELADLFANPSEGASLGAMRLELELVDDDRMPSEPTEHLPTLDLHSMGFSSHLELTLPEEVGPEGASIETESTER